MEAKIIDAQGNKVEMIDLNPEHFGIEANPHVLHEVVNSQISNSIKKTASSLTRAEVQGSGRKPFRQKGTGRARAGTRRSPVWSGGGVVFGPKFRVVESKPPKSARRLAFRMAWSDRFSSDAVVIVKDFGLDAIGTKGLLSRLADLGGTGRILICMHEKDEIIEKSARNLKLHSKKRYAGEIRSVMVKLIDGITVRDVLMADRLFLTEESLKQLQARMEVV
ncbi:MAG: 50S ribosomal protein L4 [Candidatus Coatesbacteria bacterium]|nr:50S ribosomal protein L4 [Candidatus Coatesbacteria bacterium]